MDFSFKRAIPILFEEYSNLFILKRGYIYWSLRPMRYYIHRNDTVLTITLNRFSTFCKLGHLLEFNQN